MKQLPLPTKQLTTQQLTLLKIIYKFRFATSDLISHYRGVKTSTANESLSILLKSGYISRRYEKTYKLLGKGARYYLAPMALKLLRDEQGLNQAVLHSRYKDGSVSESFVNHTLDVFRACLTIQSSHPDRFTIATKAELAGHDDFPQPLPDLYLSRNETSDTLPNDYMIDIVTDAQYFIIKKRADQYVKHFESGDWGGGVYPTVLLVCLDKRMRQKLVMYIDGVLDDKYIEESELRILPIESAALLEPRTFSIGI